MAVTPASVTVEGGGTWPGTATPGPLFRYGEPDLGSVEHFSRVYPALTEEDIQRVLDETPPPDRVRPGLVVPIEVAPGRRRKIPGRC